MKKLLITYDTVDAGIQGETCCEVEVSNAVANVLTQENIDSRQKWVKYALEGLLLNAELLKDRRYVGGIKDIRESKGDEEG